MRKYWIISLAIVVLAALFIVGCGDDDDAVTSPTSQVTPATFTNGEAYIYNGNGLYFYTYTFVHGGKNPGVDSIKIDTMLPTVYSSYYWNYADPYWYCDYYESEDISAYESGDILTVWMYGGDRSSSCSLPLLHYEDDETDIISPSYGSYVDTGATVEVVWHQVDNAEYYAIYTERRYDSSGTTIYAHDYTSTVDTTYTMSAQFTDTTVDYFYIYVMATTGPNPNSYTGNWTGTLTTGVLYSHGSPDYTRVYVSSEPPAKANSTGKTDDAAPRVTPWEIIQGVYGLNR